MNLWFVFLLSLFLLRVQKSAGEPIFSNDSKVKLPPEEELQVGSVLFDKSYWIDHCWTKEELIMLRSRKLFQTLLPKIEKIDVKDDDFVVDLLEYLNKFFRQIFDFTIGKTKHLLLKSLADTVGCYLRAQVIPIAKISFYSGSMTYEYSERIFDLYEEMKRFLHTDGHGWDSPISINRFNVTTFVNNTYSDNRINTSNCDNLITYQEGAEKRKRSYDARRRRNPVRRYRHIKNPNGSRMSRVSRNSARNLRLHLPFLDNTTRPNSIAIPFKNHSLWSLYDGESNSILAKYYEDSISCISSGENYNNYLSTFNREFLNWLRISIHPRLADDNWYPAFGGILRIMRYLEQTGWLKIYAYENLRKSKNIRNVLTNVSDATPKAKVVPQTKTHSNDVPKKPKSMDATNLIIIAISSAFLFWLFMVCVLLCYKGFCTKCPKKCTSRYYPKKFSVVYKNNGYSYPDTNIESDSSSPKHKSKSCYHGKKSKSDGHFRCARRYNSRDFACSSNCKNYRNSCQESMPASPSSSTCDNFVNRIYPETSDISSTASSGFSIHLKK